MLTITALLDRDGKREQSVITIADPILAPGGTFVCSMVVAGVALAPIRGVDAIDALANAIAVARALTEKKAG